jgi:hypothetical protein
MTAIATQFTNSESEALAALVYQSNTESHMYKVHYQLSSAEILALNSTPILLVAAPGAGYAIRVNKASALLSADGAYATNRQLQIYTTQAYPQGETVSTFLDNNGAGAPAHQFFDPITAANGEDDPISTNAALYVWVPVGNPTAGTSTCDIYVSYEIIEL